MKVVLKRVGHPAEVSVLDDDGHAFLEQAQAIVGGYIEPVHIAESIYAIVNEAGRLEKLPVNGCGFVGDFFITKQHRGSGNIIGLTDREVTKAKKWIEANNHVQPPTGDSNFRVMAADSKEAHEFRKKLAEKAAANAALWKSL